MLECWAVVTGGIVLNIVERLLMYLGYSFDIFKYRFMSHVYYRRSLCCIFSRQTKQEMFVVLEIYLTMLLLKICARLPKDFDRWDMDERTFPGFVALRTACFRIAG